MRVHKMDAHDFNRERSSQRLRKFLREGIVEDTTLEPEDVKLLQKIMIEQTDGSKEPDKPVVPERKRPKERVRVLNLGR